jgi:ABC transporter substrate binding protein
MDRRTFLAGCVSLLATPFVAETQESKAAKIGFLLGGTLSTPSVQIEPFKQTLREEGWIEGQNLTIDYRLAEGHYERLPALTRELVGRGVDVIVTDGTPQTSAAIGVTKTIPVVMATTGDPVASGARQQSGAPGWQPHRRALLLTGDQRQATRATERGGATHRARRGRLQRAQCSRRAGGRRHRRDPRVRGRRSTRRPYLSAPRCHD